MKRTETHLYRRQADGTDLLLGRVLPGGTFVAANDKGAFFWESLTEPPSTFGDDPDEDTDPDEFVDDPSWVNPRGPNVAEQLAQVVARSTYMFVETVETEVDLDALDGTDE